MNNLKAMLQTSLDYQFWHACAGVMVQMPDVNSKIYYFPQGHAEHACNNVDFSGLPKIPPLILCRVAAVEFLADPESDEVYVRIRLVPLGKEEICYEFEKDGGLLHKGADSSDDKPASFAKTLTQSDANNGGGFSVPRYCAETIFPRLDYTADPPVQTIIAKDVHGETWKFRHIYRGTPRRHLLTTGWSNFVNQKKLVAGDSIIFMRAVNGDLCVGIRRAKRAGIGGPESPSGWDSAGVRYGGFSIRSREDESKMKRSGSNGSLNSPRGGGGGGGLRGLGKLSPESVIEAVSLAASGQPFEVLYYPRASTPEFFVKASSVSYAMRVPWCPGMRFKMPFETEDSSRISWFTGTIASLQVVDSIRWPTSPWRLLQVTWDEPDLLQNVKRVNPWLVELVSNMPLLQLPPLSSPRKKLRLPQQSDFSLDGKFPTPSFLGNPLGPSSTPCCLSDNITAGIQGVRHAQLGVPLSDLHLSNKLHLDQLTSGLTRLDQLAKVPDDISQSRQDSSEEVSCLLTMGSPTQTECVKTPRFLLFGQPILTEQQMSNACSSDAVSQMEESTSLKAEKRGLDRNLVPEKLLHFGSLWNHSFKAVDIGLDTGHCKVFFESEAVGRTLDLSVLTSYDELYKRLANMFGIERQEFYSHVFYRDAIGTLKQIGDEPFSHFMKTVKRLVISTSPGTGTLKRKWITGLPTAQRVLESANRAGALSIFA